MAENNDERQDYEEKLQVILRTCLMYNTSEAMGKAVGYTLHGKGNKGFKGKPLAQLDRIYGWLCTKASEMTEKVVNLDDLLSDYKIVSEYWTSKLRRTYSCDLHKPNEEHFQRNKSLLFALLDYTLDKEAAIKKHAPLFNTDTYKKIAEDFEYYSKKIALFEPLILLLMTGLLPKYYSKQTIVDNILDDFVLFYDFLREYFQQSVAPIIISSIMIDLFNQINNVKENLREINKSSDSLKVIGELLNRLVMIRVTKELFDQLKEFTNGEDVVKNYRLRHNYSDPEIEGIWTNIDGKCKSTNFWDIKHVCNSTYLATYYEKKADSNGNYQLERNRFGWSIFQAWLTIIPFKSGADAMEFFVRNYKINNDLMVRFFVDFQSVDVGNGKSRIDKIIIPPFNVTVDWFPYREFYRVPQKGKSDKDKINRDSKSDKKEKEEDYKYDDIYKKMIEKLPLVNKTPENMDIMSTKLTCIVPEFIFIPIDECDLERMHATDKESKYLKVPKKLNPAFNPDSPFNIDIKFEMLTCKDGTIFVYDDVRLLFFEITTPEQRKEHGIELVDKIEDS